MRIAHTADIHIRSLSRHDEYRKIFSSFVDDCKTQKVDHIFVGGDIFHTKTTGISPEYIDLLTWWLKSMADVAPVHMILGNHDGNITNLSRQDAITPIVEAMNNSNVHLYKKSGIYQITPGYNLCVYSIFDESSWDKVVPISGQVNIAAYHGPVVGSVTETDWEIEGNLKVEFFDKYTVALLGDIHKTQFLGYRNKKPWIGYPGTLIQQNYAEQLEHGYLLWDIGEDDWTVKFRSLPNLQPYVTIDWDESFEKTLKKALGFPKGSRFRIRSNEKITQDDIHKLSEALKTTLSAAEVTYKSEHQVDKQSVKAGAALVSKKDLRSPEVISHLIKEYYKDKKISEEDVQIINDKTKFYLSSAISSEFSSRNSKWNLKHLKWDNLFSYGPDNQIDFDKLSGIVGIFGSNRTGKSSIVGSIMYSLFNTTDRGPMKNINVCNIRHPYCSSRAIFEHNGTTYVVERQTVKSTSKKGIVSAPTALNLFRVRDDGELDDLCGEQRADTEKAVKALIGNSEDFLMTSLSAQGETNQFLAQGATQRRAFLTKLLDLDIFDKMHDLASKDLSVLKGQLKNFPDRDWDELRKTSEQQVLDLNKKIKDAALKIADNQLVLSQLRSDLSNRGSSITTKIDVDRQREKVDDLRKKSKNYLQKIAELENENLNLFEKLKIVQQVVDSHDVHELKNRLTSQLKLEKAITDLKYVHDKEASVLVQQQKSLRILDEVPCGDDYPTCKFIKDAYSNKELSKEQKNKVDSSLEALQRAQSAFEKIKEEGLAEKIEKQEKAIALISKIKLEISKAETEIEKIKTARDSNKNLLDDAEKRLQAMEIALTSDGNEEVISIKASIDALSREIEDLDSKKIQDAAQMGKITSSMEKIEEEKIERDALLDSYRIHELISLAFSKKGIPLIVTKSQLPIINEEVSKILHGIVDFTIELESDEDTDTLEIYINYGDSKRVIELCSGMEKTMASIALRVAMTNVSSLPKPNFFIIDEGFGTLDASGVESCNRLLSSLKKHFKTIIVITHVDGIKDSADHVIDITKIEKDSKVEYV